MQYAITKKNYINAKTANLQKKCVVTKEGWSKKDVNQWWWLRNGTEAIPTYLILYCVDPTFYLK